MDIVNFLSLREMVRKVSIEDGTLYLHIFVDTQESVSPEVSSNSRKKVKRTVFTHFFNVVFTAFISRSSPFEEVCAEVIGRWTYRVPLGSTSTPEPSDDVKKHFHSNQTIFNKLSSMLSNGEFSGMKAVQVRRGMIGDTTVPGLLDFDSEVIAKSMQKDLSLMKEKGKTEEESNVEENEQEEETKEGSSD